MDLKAIQAALRERDIDGWLLSDSGIAIFGVSRARARRDEGELAALVYFIPARGTPVRLVHAVERAFLDSLPGKKHEYVAWKELHASLEKLLGAGANGDRKKIAMQYSPKNNVPYIALVDAGTLS